MGYSLAIVIKVIKALLTGESKSISVEAFRYLISSGVAFLVDLALLYVLTEFGGMHYLVSNLIAASIAMVVNYLLSAIWVFPARRLSNRAAEFAIFAGTGVAGIGLNELLLWLFTDLAGLYYMISKILAAIVGYSTKFFVRRQLLFRRRVDQKNTNE